MSLLGVRERDLAPGALGLRQTLADEGYFGAGSSISLTVQDATQAMTSDSPALTQTHILTVQNASQGHAATIVALVVDLTVQAATQAQTADNIVVVGGSTLVVASAVHAHSAESLVLVLAGDVFTLTADLTELIATYGITHARAFLIPDLPVNPAGGVVRLGGAEATVTGALTISEAGLPPGVYQLAVSYYSTVHGQRMAWTSPDFDLQADADLADLLS